jgi:hypothetical protein
MSITNVIKGFLLFLLELSLKMIVNKSSLDLLIIVFDALNSPTPNLLTVLFKILITLIITYNNLIFLPSALSACTLNSSSV